MNVLIGSMLLLAALLVLALCVFAWWFTRPPEPSKKINYMDPQQFKDEGYLHELNRTFLHPLGLALEVWTPARSFKDRLDFARAAFHACRGYQIGGVWDYRDDPEGMNYGNDTLNRQKALNIKAITIQRKPKRQKSMGYWVQPLPRGNPVTDRAAQVKR